MDSTDFCGGGGGGGGGDVMQLTIESLNSTLSWN